MTLGDVHVNKDGTIRHNGEAIGLVMKVEGYAARMGKWRAEIGNPGQPELWPPYVAAYARTRKEAVLFAIEDLEVPE